ncbi:hypothetical protein K440DRAFT_607916 [Wilcoxina mikolae CBS 423.85]|nr:hypothetical protein K440DRAFT_607916 [Wilcoxina mikolae CBS 423.85]
MSKIPALTISTTSLASEKICALRLVSDSIAQQRQTLNRRIITHPYFLAPTLSLFAIITKLNYHRTADLATVTILLAGVTIALLSLVSRYSSEYLERAEAVGNANGLRSYVDTPEREVIIAKWGERVIGTVVLHFFEGNKEAQVWTWTVEQRYRGKGLGRDLLEKAVEVAKVRMGPDYQLGWAQDHANAFRIPSLPNTFNRPFDHSEANAERILKEMCSCQK